MYKARLSKIRFNSVLNAIVSDEIAIETALRLQFNSYLYENEYFFNDKIFHSLSVCIVCYNFWLSIYGDVYLPTC